MKIKVAILDTNENYLNRISTVFTNRFSEKIEIHSFTNEEVVMNGLVRDRIDILLASDDFEIDVSKLPKRCGFAYLVNSAEIEEFRSQFAISRFQKAEIIYKEILNIYAEVITDVGGKASLNGKADMVLFFSASGGVGCSSVAVAYAKKLALSGEKVLYINLEKYGNSDVFFTGEGTSNFTDVIFSLKSKKSNLALKLESYVKEDATGVNFFSGPRTALDMLELTEEDIERLFNGINMMGIYSRIIVDVDFSINKLICYLMSQSQNIVFVSDGSEVANDKFLRAQQAVQLYEQQKDVAYLNKAGLIYNRFSNKTSKALSNSEIRDIGGIPRFEHASVDQVVEQMIHQSALNNI